MRPIDADKLIVEFLKYPMMLRHSGDFVAINLDSVIFEVRKAPTLDYKDLVPQGHWVSQANKKKCSVCEFVYYSNNEFFNFCPSCGARMKGAD